jgi:hypothetical protein
MRTSITTKKKRMRKRRKRRIGSNLARRLLAAAGMLLIMTVASEISAKDKKAAAAEYALVAGTVFRDTGMSLPGAEVEIMVVDSSTPHKSKKQKAVTDRRGEFAFRVPPVEAKYAVTAKASGYVSQKKEVTVAGFERIDVFFRLEPASKQ